VFIGCAA